jgi:acetolactate decarboxylase
MMHAGDTEAKVNLAGLLPDPELYAVGALSGLRGEITIIGGAAWLAYPDADTNVRSVKSTSSTEDATLLVAQRIGAWTESRVPEPVAYEALDQRLGEMARQAGLPDGEPFVFVVRGEVADLEWHVIDGRRLGPEGGGHASHRQAAVVRTAAAARATLVGFYSTRHGGIFTHVGARTHIHGVVGEDEASGHVDHVTLPAGTVIAFGTASDR